MLSGDLVEVTSFNYFAKGFKADSTLGEVSMGHFIFGRHLKLYFT